MRDRSDTALSSAVLWNAGILFAFDERVDSPYAARYKEPIKP